MTFSISALVLARDSHIKPDSEAQQMKMTEYVRDLIYGVQSFK